MQILNLDEADSSVAALVKRAAGGEEIVITQGGVACARLVPIAAKDGPRVPAQTLKIDYIADDFDEPDPRIARMFGIDPD